MREILYFCLAVVLILMICLLWFLFLYGKLRRQQENLMESFHQLQKMNGTLRSQRHDYLNHMQVVYGMLELEEYQKLQKYLEPICKNLMKTGKAIRTSIPAVNALLMAKLGEAEVASFFVCIPVGIWISAIAANVKVGIFNLVGMKLRRVSPARIVFPLIKAVKAS